MVKLISSLARCVFYVSIVVLSLSTYQCLGNDGASDRFVVESALNERDMNTLADDHGFKVIRRLMDRYYVLQEKREDSEAVTLQRRTLDEAMKRLASSEHVQWLTREEHKPFSKRDSAPIVPDYNDPLFPDQWYYQSEMFHSGDYSGDPILTGSDHSIIDVWKMGFNGTGVRVVVIDDGLDHTHLDLHDNYDPEISTDLNTDDDNDRDPQPRIADEDPEFNAHGTKCGGQIAAIADNEICGVGIAHGAKIGGVRILDGKVTDSMEAEAFKLQCEIVDIYSMSWGPMDDGMTFGGFMKLSYEAIEGCINNGRRGLGSIYVWASGNGGSSDCCSADSLVSSPYTVSIAALTHDGKPAYFQETCPSTIAAVYTGGVSRSVMDKLSKGGEVEKSHPMVTTNIMFDHDNPASSKNCDKYFSGTSAAGPLGAGMIALLLQSNPQLTWRDVQHVIVETCDQPNPDGTDKSRGPWELNGDGRTVSHDFGFGVMNAAKMVIAATEWTNVPPREKCIVGDMNNPRPIPDKRDPNQLTVDFDASVCEGTVNFVEHVVAIISYNSTFRGSVFINLAHKHPNSIEDSNEFVSRLMRTRRKDVLPTPVDKWPFTSILHWGEESKGTWSVTVAYDKDMLKGNQKNSFKAELMHVQLVLYGTESRHVNPSKSNPQLATITDKTEVDEVLQEQFTADKALSNQIGTSIDDAVVERREVLSERMSEMSSSREMGGQAAFEDPYSLITESSNPKTDIAGVSPRKHRRNGEKRATEEFFAQFHA